MKKWRWLVLSAFVLMGLFSCSSNGGVVVFTADSLSKASATQEKTIRINGHDFIIYNVYNDGNGNFVMASNSSYIRNYDIQFGLSVNTKWVYDISKADKNGPNDFSNYTLLEGNDRDGNLSFEYSVANFGIEIRGIGFSVSMSYENVNIGTITSWC